MNKLRDMKEFKGTIGVYEIVEHNWSETSIMCNGKTICSFKLDDIEEDLTENDLTEEENAYNIQLIKHSKEVLEMLEGLVYQFESVNNSLQEDELLEQAKQLIKQATEL